MAASALLASVVTLAAISGVALSGALADPASRPAAVVDHPRPTAAAPGPPTAPQAPIGAGRYGWPLMPRPAVLRTFAPGPLRWSAGHRGVDLAAAPGQPVLAVADGRVTFAGPVAGRGVVVVAHPDGLRTTYEPVEPAVAAGEPVRRGSALGTLAPAGSHCDQPCLHWGALRRTDYVDPLTLLHLVPPVLLPLAGRSDVLGRPATDLRPLGPDRLRVHGLGPEGLGLDGSGQLAAKPPEQPRAVHREHGDEPPAAPVLRHERPAVRIPVHDVFLVAGPAVAGELQPCAVLVGPEIGQGEVGRLGGWAGSEQGGDGAVRVVEGVGPVLLPDHGSGHRIEAAAAVPRRHDAGRLGCAGVVGADPSLDVQTASGQPVDLGSRADRHQDDVRRQLSTVREPDAAHHRSPGVTAAVPEQGVHADPGDQPDAVIGVQLPADATESVAEHGGQGDRGRLDDSDVHPELPRGGRDLRTDEARSHHDEPGTRQQGFAQGYGIIEAAQRVHPGQAGGSGQSAGPGSAGEHDAVPADPFTRRQPHLAPDRVEGHGHGAGAQVDRQVLVLRSGQTQCLDGHGTGEELLGQRRPVIRGVMFLPQQHDSAPVVERPQGTDGAQPGQARAHHDDRTAHRPPHLRIRTRCAASSAPGLDGFILISRYTEEVPMIHHVQLACPAGSEPRLRAFYDGVLGLSELPKPPTLARRGGCWFRGHGIELHLGVEADFRPARKAHPGLLVADIDTWADRLQTAGAPVTWDDDFPGMRRFYSSDPVGNRLEFLQPLDD